MLFNSLAFGLFLPLVFALYWALAGRPVRWQNALLIGAGCVFYGAWDPRFVLLLVGNATLDYWLAQRMEATPEGPRRKRWLRLSLLANLGVLGLFKYYNFFTAGAVALAGGLGLPFDPWLVSLVLPVGISFYTFHNLGYTIDVYYGRIRATRDLAAFLAFVSFFPLLVAGPIIRARKLLGAFEAPRRFDAAAAAEGLRQMLWGFVKKMVVADNCAREVDAIFTHADSQSAGTLALGAILFAIQIYADFSGYSDIAIGCARLFGFSIEPNFRFPYFARSIREFWQRWHISLTSWFRDFVYIPLGGNRRGTARTLLNVLLVFGLSGLWHGANLTFVAWGLGHGLLYLPSVAARQAGWNGPALRGGLKPVVDGFRTLLTFTLVTLLWIFFRASSLEAAGLYYERLFTEPHWGASLPGGPGLWCSIAVVLVVEWLSRRGAHEAAVLSAIPVRVLRWAAYLLLLFFIYRRGAGGQNFVYFQF